jgi:hypothetical protein
MKKLFYMMGCLLVLSSSPVWAQGDQPNVVVVRTSESNLKLFILTARGGEKAEREEFKYSTKDYYEQVLAKYQQLIASYLDKGYVLHSMTSPVFGSNTFVFVKGPKP